MAVFRRGEWPLCRVEAENRGGGASDCSSLQLVSNACMAGDLERRRANGTTKVTGGASG